jgi:tetratricopeptide (TPR) repeat protein
LSAPPDFLLSLAFCAIDALLAPRISLPLLRKKRDSGVDHLDKAAARYREIVAQDPKNADALNLLGVIESQRKNPTAAIELIDRAIKIQPKNADFLCNRGVVLQQLKRFEDASPAMIAPWRSSLIMPWCSITVGMYSES